MSPAHVTPSPTFPAWRLTDASASPLPWAGSMGHVSMSSLSLCTAAHRSPPLACISGPQWLQLPLSRLPAAFSPFTPAWNPPTRPLCNRPKMRICVKTLSAAPGHRQHGRAALGLPWSDWPASGPGPLLLPYWSFAFPPGGPVLPMLRPGSWHSRCPQVPGGPRVSLACFLTHAHIGRSASWAPLQAAMARVPSLYWGHSSRLLHPQTLHTLRVGIPFSCLSSP